MRKSNGWIILVFLTGCSFNKMYYEPTPVPASAKKVRMIDKETNDTTFISLDNQHQPSFTNAKGEIKELEYTVLSHNFLSTSGSSLNAWLLTPKNVQIKASVLFLHGNSGNIITHFPGLIPLVKKGYQFFIFDYSGYGYSTGKSKRNIVLKDAQSALEYFDAYIEPLKTKLIIYGQSLGGHLAVVLASQNQDIMDALVIEGAFSSHKDIAAETIGFLGRWMVKESYSAKESIKTNNKPVLIIHSSEDETIPFEMGKALYENANEPKQFFEIKGPHMTAPVLYTDSIDVLLEKMIE